MSRCRIRGSLGNCVSQERRGNEKEKKKRTRIASNDDKAVVGVIVAADRLVIAMHVGNFKEPLNLFII